MEFIELHDIDKYTEYLQETENTICGKHIISILLHVNNIFITLKCIQKS
jgi:predicted class III extradiol MEMO1 family dioxygenase